MRRKRVDWRNTPAYAGKTRRRRPSEARARKHPRLRGEDLTPGGSGRRPRETPPLTRGRRSSVRTLGPRRGNTPAYAGKTRPGPDYVWDPSKHPRLRGEDHGDGRESIESLGNTPAYAGKTIVSPLSSPVHQKHPRLRGEDLFGRGFVKLDEETPPLTRGRLHVQGIRRKAPRNTPAYAGKTQGSTNRDEELRKHPRLRGEDDVAVKFATGLRETPPLTRGRQSAELLVEGARGNTPAYAGKTMSKEEHAAAFEKHPRLRGEDSTIFGMTDTPQETPPLTRGRPEKSP